MRFKPLAGFKTTARVLGTVITYRLVLSFLLAMTDTNYAVPQGTTLIKIKIISVPLQDYFN
ncbi:MAG: hypothetical protein LBD53_11630 [Tannerella sp.]|nr:hypothetical protein [Tannerella sp.]